MTEQDEMSEELQDMFAEFAAKYTQSALSLITGLFVGLLEYELEKQGYDKNKEIKIDGGSRSITISAMTH